jgi:hypothetical protein
MITIKVAQEFSRFPAGRFVTDGPFSGEHFRTRFLEPHLRRKESLIVDLDGARGYGSSFLEEAFGGLVRVGLAKSEIIERLQFLATNSSLIAEIRDYINKAVPLNA